uniref:CID domain-containing protein n=1 Tax=Plectus sambesii TaxID=2011161 RepID=A0A914W2J4_9BILA
MSVGFSEQAMAKKLEQLNNTMQSIQTLSLWLLHHRKHSQRIAQVWQKEVLRETKPGRMLSLIYLANDVIQNSRKKWPLFQEHFYHVLEKALAHVAKHADDNTLNSVKRVITVWKERNVFGGSTVEKLLGAMTSVLSGSRVASLMDDMATTPPREEQQPSTSAVVSPITPPDSGRSAIKRKSDVALEDSTLGMSAPTTAELLRALRQLEDPASADGDTRQQIASFPEAVANPAFLRQIANSEQADVLHKKIKEAEPVVDDYCKRLSKEMEHRRETQQMLIDYLRVQKEKATNTQDLLNRFREKREKLKTDRVEVYKHYESLPDLSKLPNMEQLNPLPSAGELFDKK